MRVCVIGGGPAGLMAAYQSFINGNDTTLFEKNEKIGKKLYITGKGRCNLTNNCDNEEFLKNVVRNPKFMISSINQFNTQDTISLFEAYGLELKTERGNRVFPVSDKSSDVIKTMQYMLEGNVDIHLNECVKSINKNEYFIIKTDKSSYSFDKVIIATGGLSYPLTGSTGDGYKFAKYFDINVTKCYPSLVGVNLVGGCKDLSGLSLKNVSLKCFNGEKLIYDEFGELLFTHTGISGPLVLSLSSVISGMQGNFTIKIDLKPALNEETLDERVIKDFSKNINKAIKNSLGELLLSSLIPIVLEQSKIDGEEKCNSITREKRLRFISVLKGLTFKVQSLRGFEEAVITNGGIDVKEINPSTLECKKVPGLYFAGEVIDVDAYTGGFNIQIALSTGFVAGNLR